jgi:serine/threonine protein kinase
MSRNRYGQYRVEVGQRGKAHLGIKGQRHDGADGKLRPSTGARLQRAQSAGRTRSSAVPGYWGPQGKASAGQHAYYPGGVRNPRPASAGSHRGPVVSKPITFYKQTVQDVATKETIAKQYAIVKKSSTPNPAATGATATSATLSMASGSQNMGRSNPNAPIIKTDETMASLETSSAKGKTPAGKQDIAKVDPKGFEEMRDANRKLAERNAKLRDELQELREQQQRMQEQAKADAVNKTTAAVTGAADPGTRAVYQPSSGTGVARHARPSSAGPVSAGGAKRPTLDLAKYAGGRSHSAAQGSPRNAVVLKRQEEARTSYSRQPRPQSAGGARPSTSATATAMVKEVGSRPENRPGSAGRRREIGAAQVGSSGRVQRPSSAPARRPDNKGAIQKMVADAQQLTGAEEEARIRSIVSAETWDGRGRSDMYHFGKVLGTGSFGVVRLVLHKLTNTKIAVKTYDKRKIKDAAQLKRVQQEIRLMARTNHPNIVRLYETLESVHRVHLVMEYASGGNLCNYVKLKKRLDENEARAIFQQLASAIAYLHTLDIVHRDIKLENILIDGKRNIKITDFGFSVFVQQKKLKIFCGTPSYMPPEIVMRKEYYGPPVDCWSLGVLLYATLCGCFPFTANSYPNLYKKIARGQWRAAHSMSQGVSDLLRRMLTVDASKRIDMKQVCRHQWTRSGNAYQPLSPNVCSHLVSENPADDLALTSVTDEMKRHGFRQQAIAESVMGRKKNHVSTTFYLLAEKLGPTPLGPRGTNGQSCYSGSSASSTGRSVGTYRPSSASGSAKLLSEMQKKV